MSTKTIRCEEYPDKEIQSLREGDTLVWIALEKGKVVGVYVYRHIVFENGESIPCTHLPIFMRRARGRNH